ncbi:flagellar motor protein [Oceanisphaera psychrotolerans]|uniref:Flagellar motor protein n=1 Tax=Oceanisphaera psychrotolerans TaxID=1414654 RepID=A0A1J4QC79_9GAMM|nr:flagellar motor protein [Oceanisphaera psychrotolerans]OIN07695.1 flagellar motor protein [Oceanisphaera psychrotolerans]
MALTGLLLALVCITLAQWWHGGSLWGLLDGPALLIVCGGTLGAVLLQTPWPQCKSALKALTALFGQPAWPFHEQAARLLRWSNEARKGGFLALEPQLEHDALDDFTRQGLQWLVDGTEPAALEQLLDNELDRIEEQKELEARVFEAMGGYSPTIGIIGAVLGLIQAMSNLEDPGQLGTGIAVAFVATLYGVGLANLLLLPLANRLRAIYRLELRYRELTAIGLLAIARGDGSLAVGRQLAQYQGQRH